MSGGPFVKQTHVVCRDREWLFENDSRFVSAKWRLPLDRIARGDRFCVHQDRASPAYLVGRIEEAWLCPESGRVVVMAAREDVVVNSPKTWGFWLAYSYGGDGEVARLIVRAGFMVCAADGLDAAEKASLEGFASVRTHMPLSEIRREAKHAVELGKGCLSDLEVAKIAALGSEELTRLFAEFAVAAAADGRMSPEESEMLDHLRHLTGLGPVTNSVTAP